MTSVGTLIPFSSMLFPKQHILKSSENEIESELLKLQEKYKKYAENPHEHPQYSQEWIIYYTMINLHVTLNPNCDPINPQLKWPEHWQNRMNWHYRTEHDKNCQRSYRKI